MHVDASLIVVGIVLAQPGEGKIDHLTTFTSRKLSDIKKKYKTIEREGLAMIYALQNFRYYLLGSKFKFFTYHSALKYLVNKPVLGGTIYRWLLLLQEFDFEAILKPGKQNFGLGYLSQIQSGESSMSIDDLLPDAHLFRVEVVDDHFSNIDIFLMTRIEPMEPTTSQKKQLVTKSVNYQLIVG